MMVKNILRATFPNTYKNYHRMTTKWEKRHILGCKYVFTYNTSSDRDKCDVNRKTKNIQMFKSKCFILSISLTFLLIFTHTAQTDSHSWKKLIYNQKYISFKDLITKQSMFNNEHLEFLSHQIAVLILIP